MVPFSIEHVYICQVVWCWWSLVIIIDENKCVRVGASCHTGDGMESLHIVQLLKLSPARCPRTQLWSIWEYTWNYLSQENLQLLMYLTRDHSNEKDPFRIRNSSWALSTFQLGLLHFRICKRKCLTSSKSVILSMEKISILWTIFRYFVSN